jgi:hypothetical protein
MKLKEINFNEIEFNPVVKKEFDNGTLINLSIKGSNITFQTPKLIIKEIFKDYLILSISNSFKERILKLEEHYSSHFKKRINSLINNDEIVLKIKYSKDNPVLKVYDNLFNLVNFYSLQKGDKVIVSVLNKCLWINDIINLNLIIEEIMVIKE